VLGTTVGGYRLDSVLGQGGMATVYGATDLKLGRAVAVKVLLDEFSRDPIVQERFRRESTALAALAHPHILTIFTAGEERGTAYYAMELINAPTLYELMVETGYPSRSLPLPRVVEILTGTLDALAYCHARQVLHRDLKPANVFVDRTRGAILGDFGLAQLSLMSKLTVKGTFLGTELYASPEQLLGQDLDGRSDIYQMGLILYELAAGRLPFPNVMGRIWESKCKLPSLPPPRDLNPAIPPELEAVMLRAVTRSKSERFQLAEDFKHALEGLHLA
jgi:eukaryotic-like serine/threonine-protein kinase